jgi:hypothetical protein
LTVIAAIAALADHTTRPPVRHDPNSHAPGFCPAASGPV